MLPFFKNFIQGFDFALQTVGKSSRDDLEWNHRVPLKGITGEWL